jgi:uncharacterized repeat protein (TIGR01451 family)
MREIRHLFAAAAALVIALTVAPAALADQSPAGCAGSPPTVTFASETLDQLKTPVRQGDPVVLGARITNKGESACDLSELKIRVRLPDPDGTPGDTYRTLTSGAFLAAGHGVEGFTEAEPYVVDLDDGVFEAPLEISWQAQIHDGEQNSSVSGEGAPVKLSLTRPRTNLVIKSSPATGTSPLLATTTYSLTNTSPAPVGDAAAPGLLPDGVNGLRDVITDANCRSIVYLSGDVDLTTEPGPVLDPGETWRFICARTYLRPGTYSSQPTITGVSDADGRPWPQPAAETDLAQVKVLGPDLIVDKNHQGDLLAGGTGEYKLTVTNSGNQATSGQVVVYDLLPVGLTATDISGEGWNCVLSSLSCARSDPLGSGLSYPDVTVSVGVADSPPESVINSARVAGGGEPAGASGNNSDDDPTTVRAPATPDMPTSNRFTVGKPKTRNNGSVAIPVTVPGRGKLKVDDASAPDLVRKATKRTGAYGSYTLVAKLRPRLYRKLKRTGNTRSIKLKITFKPTGAKPSSKRRQAQFRVRQSIRSSSEIAPPIGRSVAN